MRNLSSFISDFLSGSPKQRSSSRPTISSNPTVREKKAHVLGIISEVSNLLDSCNFELNDATINEINKLKNEFRDLSKDRDAATEKLSKTRSHLKFITQTSEQLKSEYAKSENEIVELTERLNKLEIKDRQLKDAELLDLEIDELKSKISNIKDEMAPSISKQNEFFSKIDSFTETKTDLNKKMASTSFTLETLRKDVPELVKKKDNAEKHIQLIKGIQQEYEKAEEENNSLNKENEELESETSNIQQALTELEEKQRVLQKSLDEQQTSKKIVDKKINDLEACSKKIKQLNEELEPTSNQRDKLANKLEDLKAKVNIARKDKEELEKTLENRSSLQQDFEALKEKTKSIVDSLDNLEKLKITSENAKEKHRNIIEKISSRREGIQKMEVRGHSYKKAFEKLADTILMKG